MKSKNGISLVVLIITIIVLIILTAVVMNTLVADNSIMNKATEAKNSYEDTTIKEKIQVAYLAALTNGNGTLSEENLITALDKQFGANKYTLVGDKVIIDGKEYSINKAAEVASIPTNDPNNPNNQTLTARAISENASTYYGKTVNYDIPIKTSLNDQWKIFYADNDNIFLIADGYISNVGGRNYVSLPLSEAGLTESGIYGAYWKYKAPPAAKSVPTSTDENETIAALPESFMFTKWTKYNQFNCEECVSTMLQNTADTSTNIWRNFVNSTYADFAIGGPTLEMLFASYNEANGVYYNCEPNGYYGYGIRTTTRNSLVEAITEMFDTTKTLYVPNTEELDGTIGYWVASPCCGHGDYPSWVRIVTCTGDVRGQVFSANDPQTVFPSDLPYTLGFRPVVRLKNNITLKNSTTPGYDYELSI